MNPIERAKQNPKSLRWGVNAACYSCMGEGGNPNTPQLIRDCNCDQCPLYAVRPYQRPPKRLSLRKAINAKCYECVGGDADTGPYIRVRTCDCNDCPLHPVRPWQKVKKKAA